jgi:signal transduction histidine kinase
MTAGTQGAGPTTRRERERPSPTRSWTLRGLITRICVVAAVLAGVVVGFGAVTLQESRDSLRFRQRVLVPASVSAQNLYRAMLDQETGARGYTITGDRAFLQPYDEGRAAAPLLSEQLRELTRDDDGLVQQLGAIEAASARWSSQAAQRQVELVGSGRQDEAIDLVKSGIGKRLFGDVRTQLETLIEDIDERRLASATAVDRRVSWLGGIAIGGALVALAASLLIWWVVRRSVSTPLDRLRRETSAVAAGELDTPITRGGPMEIDELGRSVENMRTMLLDQIHAAFSNGVIDAEVAERTRLANDLHDDPIQRLTALQWKLEGALSHDDATVRSATVAAVAGLTDVQLRLRNLMFQLHPPAIETDGLEAALDELLLETFEGTSLTWELTCDDTAAIPPPTLAMAYRFIAEALRNIRKHAQATSVVVEVHVNDGIAAAVVDDGVGFDLDDARGADHRGLVIGPQLAHALGGWWRIHSRRRADPGEQSSGAGPHRGVAARSGTTVAFWLPLGSSQRNPSHDRAVVSPR